MFGLQHGVAARAATPSTVTRYAVRDFRARHSGRVGQSLSGAVDVVVVSQFAGAGLLRPAGLASRAPPPAELCQVGLARPLASPGVTPSNSGQAGAGTRSGCATW